jgi:hypothetical protein
MQDTICAGHHTCRTPYIQDTIHAGHHTCRTPYMQDTIHAGHRTYSTPYMQDTRPDTIHAGHVLTVQWSRGMINEGGKARLWVTQLSLQLYA